MRRNSLTTLHPLPQDENESRVTELPKLMTRVNTFIPDRVSHVVDGESATLSVI